MTKSHSHQLRTYMIPSAVGYGRVIGVGFTILSRTQIKRRDHGSQNADYQATKGSDS